jgi:nicotinamide mononucleotide transporter
MRRLDVMTNLVAIQGWIDVSSIIQEWVIANWVELAGALISLACVWFNARQKVIGWPLAMLGAALYAVVFAHSKLYADVFLQGVFFVLGGYGWYQWLYGGRQHTELRATNMPLKFVPLLLGFGSIATLTAGYLLTTYTDADIAYIDAFTTVVSLIAQWMLARKYIENWLVWIAINIVYVGVYAYKNLFLTSGLYAIFIILAVYGYLSWKKTLQPQNTVSA